MSITADEEGRLSMSPIEHHEKEVANSLHQTLSERGKRYGDFTDNARIAEAINQAMLSGLGWQRMRPVQREALRIIASKISRMCSCDPEYLDNWHDIAGYATLVEQRCQAKEPTKTRWPNPSPPEFSEEVERALRQAPHGCLVGDEQQAKPLGEGGSFIGTSAGMYAQDAKLPGYPHFGPPVVRPLPSWSPPGGFLRSENPYGEG